LDFNFVKKLKTHGLTWDDYLVEMGRAAEQDPAGLGEVDAERLEFSKLNLHRMSRIGLTWKPSEALAIQLSRLDRLHFFYGRNRGRALDDEFVDILDHHPEGTP